MLHVNGTTRRVENVHFLGHGHPTGSEVGKIFQPGASVQVDGGMGQERLV